MLPTINDILEWISHERERNQRELADTKKLGGHSSYGAGVEWGAIEICNRLEDFINGIEN